ncbi:MAG: metallophosphoesterase [Acidobacteria bacterium]|nr:metallophosphoesterase [Acidobacteriota bacterium]
MRIGGRWALVTLVAVVSLPVDAQSLRPAAPPPPTVFAVGDIVHCAAPEAAEMTGRLMERLLNETPHSIGITLGDNSNDDGSEASYGCFDRTTWGRLMPRLHPTPGNHDYIADAELPYYYLYFPNAGRPRLGYRAWNVGEWRLYALNTELPTPELRQAQLAWLEQDLSANHKSRCVLAYFHRPPFSSGNFASVPRALPIFRKLFKYGGDLVVTGHEHFFSTLPPLAPDGIVNRSHGIPTLIAGTGGAVFFNPPARLRYSSAGEAVLPRQLGILRIVLKPSSFEWAFIPVDPAVRAPSGTGTCHENPPGVTG